MREAVGLAKMSVPNVESPFSLSFAQGQALAQTFTDIQAQLQGEPTQVDLALHQGSNVGGKGVEQFRFSVFLTQAEVGQLNSKRKQLLPPKLIGRTLSAELGMKGLHFSNAVQSLSRFAVKNNLQELTRLVIGVLVLFAV